MSLHSNPAPSITCLILALHCILIGNATAEIVINEVHYNSEPNNEASEFVELYNSGANKVDLSGWFFSKGALGLGYYPLRSAATRQQPRTLWLEALVPTPSGNPRIGAQSIQSRRPRAKRRPLADGCQLGRLIMCKAQRR